MLQGKTDGPDLKWFDWLLKAEVLMMDDVGLQRLHRHARAFLMDSIDEGYQSQSTITIGQ